MKKLTSVQTYNLYAIRKGKKNENSISTFYFLQASEDAKKLVNQERSFACAEIESARAVVQRIGEALEEQETNSQVSGKQVLYSSNFFLTYSLSRCEA